MKEYWLWRIPVRLWPWALYAIWGTRFILFRFYCSLRWQGYSRLEAKRAVAEVAQKALDKMEERHGGS